MEETPTMENKKILVVDDEIDILETLEELLEDDDFSVDSAASFEEAVSFLKSDRYDVAILDIMGVRGYDLLEATHKMGIPTLMLTGHAFSPDNLKKSIEMGADAYIPKDKMVDITLYVDDVLASRKNRKNGGGKWYEMLQPIYNGIFGDGWKKKEEDFWEKFDKKYLTQ
jgi:DNA-binding response OmpR family regulator